MEAPHGPDSNWVLLRRIDGRIGGSNCASLASWLWMIIGSIRNRNCNLYAERPIRVVYQLQ